ncbi:MAG TPA: hypothetical protein VGF01_01955 [Terracidiphilus sp.]
MKAAESGAGAEWLLLAVAFDQYAEEAEQELHILFGLGKRERIDCEVARFLANIEIRSAKDRRQ